MFLCNGIQQLCWDQIKMPSILRLFWRKKNIGCLEDFLPMFWEKHWTFLKKHWTLTKYAAFPNNQTQKKERESLLLMKFKQKKRMAHSL